MFKFLPGIIFIQIISAILVVIAFSGLQEPQLIVVLVMFALIIALLTAFWFAYIARDLFKQERQALHERHAQDREYYLLTTEREKANSVSAQSKLQERHAREREMILLDAEREKANIAAESYRRIEAESRKAHARANLKVGAAFALATAAGSVMIISQLVTVGMMVLVASGSGLTGYLARARHERLARVKRLANEEQRWIEKP